MSRIQFALGLLAFVCASLAIPAFAQQVDQSGWNARKQQVELPNGTRMSYVELGDPSGSPVLLLHGYTDSSRVWTILAPQLLEHRLLIVDLRGHGGSSVPECCYALADFAYDAKLFLDSKGIGKASVVGHSLGSMIAQVMAAEYPERVERLALVGSTVLAPATRGNWMWTNILGLKEPVASNREFLREWTANPTPVDPEFAAYSQKEIEAVPMRVWRGVLRELADVPVGRLAPDVKAPILILSAGKDALFGPEHHQALLKAYPHAEERVFHDLGHNLILERPEEVGPVLAGFLKGKSAR